MCRDVVCDSRTSYQRKHLSTRIEALFLLSHVARADKGLGKPTVLCCQTIITGRNHGREEAGGRGED